VPSASVTSSTPACSSGTGFQEACGTTERPLRREYALTRMGLEFVYVLMAIVAWGDRWTAGEAGPPALYRHRACGEITQVVPHCSACGEEMHSTDVEVEPGPGSREGGPSAALSDSHS
jgi:hypothetical protein